MAESWNDEDTVTSVVIQEPAQAATGVPAACVVHVSEGHAQTRTRVLDDDEVTIGRGTECSLVIPVSHVSRVHATIRREDKGWAIYDNESVNGILVNGIRRRFALLHFGDRVDLGRGEILLYRPYDSEYQRALEAQKLEALGRLASGIAHDFNNVLMAIVGATSGIREDFKAVEGSLPDAKTTGQTLDDIMLATETGGDLARQLLNFAKRGSISSERIDVDDLVGEVTRLVSRIFDQSIVVKTECNTKASVIACRSQLSQVLMNLCINARDAMPHGGTLSVKAEDCEAPKGAAAGKYVQLRISDTGVGMTPEVRDRVFEPFFSTKGEGAGTGLGMATSYGVVKQYGGTIEIQSEPGEGTEVDVVLPVQSVGKSKHDTKSLNRMTDGDEVLGNGRRILLAEDQDLVRKHTSRLLERMGFYVIECVDGVEAVTAVEASQEPIALAMIDLQMPRRSGDEACRMIRALDPDLPIVMVSGNTEDPRIEALINSEDVDVLTKPYGVAALRMALGQAR
jgi:signal transduction histidine kinase/CheY-like chemotaxis protein